MENTDGLPVGWSWSTLPQAVGPKGMFCDGDWIETKDQDPAGHVHLIQLADIGEGAYRDRSSRFLTGDKATELGCTLLEEGDILIARMADPLGRACVFPGDSHPCVTAVDVCIARPDGELAENRWLMHSINSPQFRAMVSAQQSGSTRARIARSKLGRLPVPLPPLPEQRRLVEKIERLLVQSRTAREALDRVPPLLKRFRQAVLAKAFRGELTERDPSDEPASVVLERIRDERRRKWEEDLRAKGKDPRRAKYIEPEPADARGLPELPEGWAWVAMGELLMFVGSGITPRGGRKVYVDDGVIFVRSQNVYPGRILIGDVVHITPRQHESMIRTAIRAGDVLLNITGASIGRSAPVMEDMGPANVNQHVCILRPFLPVDSNFASMYLNSPTGQNQIMTSQGGVTRQGLNYEQVRRLAFPIAPGAEQRRIAAKIEALFALAEWIEHAVERARFHALHVDQALLARAFRGEL